MTLLKDPLFVPTTPLVALGLVGGYGVARTTGVRALGGVVLAGAGALAGREWLAKRGPLTAAALTGIYLGSFVGSHKLAKSIGAWPSVGVVTAASVASAWAFNDRL